MVSIHLCLGRGSFSVFKFISFWFVKITPRVQRYSEYLKDLAKLLGIFYLLTFPQPKVKLVFSLFKALSDLPGLLNALISLNTSFRLQWSSAILKQETTLALTKGIQNDGKGCSQLTSKRLLMPPQCLSSDSHGSLLPSSPAVPIGKSTVTTFPSLESASGDPGKPPVPLFIWQMCCLWGCGSLWASLALGLHEQGKPWVLWLVPKVSGCPSPGRLSAGIISVCNPMCNPGMQSTEKIFIIAWLSAEDNFNYSGISMDEEAL